MHWCSPSPVEGDSSVTAFRNNADVILQRAPQGDYLCCAEQDLHALSCQEGLPARPEVGNMLEAEQKRPADQYIGIGCVMAVPVLMQPEQARDIASVHRPAAVRLWKQWKKRQHQSQVLLATPPMRYWFIIKGLRVTFQWWNLEDIT